MKAAVRFWSKVDKSNPEGCWIWTAATYLPPRFPYGRFKYNGATGPAHRVAWILDGKEISDGLWVLHKCDNPKCVRPDHLFLGTPLDNVRDCYSKGRQSKEYSQLLNRFGDKNGNVKLSEPEAVEILSKLKAGMKPMRLAEVYGVTVGAIYHLRSGFTWPNLSSHRT